MDFSGVPALRNVDFSVRPGEIRALIGANGAGKSTLMKILAGANPSYTGTILLDGAAIALKTPRDAQAHGIRLVSQEMDTALVPGLSIAENILMADLNARRGGLVDWKSARLDAKIALRAMGCTLDVNGSIDSLSPAQKQMVLLARVLVRENRFLLLDEPTAPLSAGETEILFQSLRRLAKQQHVGIILVSHRLRELLAVCESMTVLRDGLLVRTFVLDGSVSEAEIIRMMSGREMQAAAVRKVDAEAPPYLTVRGISDRSGKLHNVSLCVRQGEIVGIGGLAGAGKTELCHALFGALALASGTMQLRGAPYAARTPQQAVENGVALIPEERRRQGIWPDEPLRFTLVARLLRQCAKAGLLSRTKETRLSARLIEDTGIKAASTEQPMRFLSGGNQQKAVIGKWLRTDATLFLFDEATKGVDAAAREDIFALIRSLADEGRSVLYASGDPEELMLLCDRIYIMYRGRVVCERRPSEIVGDELLRYAAGGEANET